MNNSTSIPGHEQEAMLSLSPDLDPDPGPALALPLTLPLTLPWAWRIAALSVQTI